MSNSTFTVTQLNRRVRLHLEDGLGSIKVIGELSNYKQHTSGHSYFTLKDDTAQIRCAFFKNYQKMTKNFRDGDQVVTQGIVSLYETRGDYQLIVHSMETYGLGELYRQFELLKQKLDALGLFATDRKRPLPLYPNAIGVITSTKGAAIHDILTTLKRRYPLATVYIYGVEVQGAGAASQIIAALQKANQDKHCDVLILARGGGSLEDLMPFNDEQLAYTIYKSHIPIISGVGHESDITIADFVADARAATPTAAALSATPDAQSLLTIVQSCQSRLNLALNRMLEQLSLRLQHAQTQLNSFIFLLNKNWQSVDLYEKNVISASKNLVLKKQQRLNQLTTRLTLQNPAVLHERYKINLVHLKRALHLAIEKILKDARNTFTQQLSTLHTVSPLATLARGYAIATYGEQVLLDSQQVQIHDTIRVKLSRGALECVVKESIC